MDPRYPLMSTYGVGARFRAAASSGLLRPSPTVVTQCNYHPTPAQPTTGNTSFSETPSSPFFSVRPDTQRTTGQRAHQQFDRHARPSHVLMAVGSTSLPVTFAWSSYSRKWQALEALSGYAAHPRLLAPSGTHGRCPPIEVDILVSKHDHPRESTDSLN